MIALTLWLGCGGAGSDGALRPDAPAAEPIDPGGSTGGDEPAAPLDPVRLLTRASLDLRGVRPSLDELHDAQRSPAAVDAYIAAWLDGPEFPGRLREVYDEVFRIRDEVPFVSLGDLVTSVPVYRMWAAVGEEPTRMLEQIAAEDLPYSEWVTADWTMADETLAALLPVDYPAGAVGWRKVRYTDGRPPAGVLVSSGWWWQQGSMLNNLNRGRANQVSRVLMCFDYLQSEIDFTGVSALDSEEALGAAIRLNPSCAACHDSLDPLASMLYGFWYPSGAKHDLYDIRSYHPERERLWQDLGGLPPAWHGQPMSGLRDLGEAMAAERGYARCFVENSFEGLLRRSPTAEDEALLDAAEAAFVDGGLKVRDAWRVLLASDAWRRGEGEGAWRMVSPAVLSRSIADLTGFRWTEDGWELLRAPETGYGPLAGGVDGITRTTRMVEPTPTLVVVQSHLANMAGAYVASNDLDGAGDRRLLSRVDRGARPETDAAAMRAQIVDLHLRVASEVVTPDSDAVDDELGLWGEVFEGSQDPVTAWAAVVTLLLRHPNVVVY